MAKKFQKKLASLISVVLHPFFLILVSILIGIDKSDLSSSKLIIFTISALVLNGLSPVCYTFYLTQKGMVLDDSLDNKEVLKNRPFLLAGGTIILFFEMLVLGFFKNPQPLFTILMTLLFLTFALFLISLYRKISLHVAFITTISLIVVFLFGYSFWPILVLIPISIWSRIILKRHTFKQIIAGFLLSLLITSLVFYSYGYLNPGFHIPAS